MDYLIPTINNLTGEFAVFEFFWAEERMVFAWWGLVEKLNVWWNNKGRNKMNSLMIVISTLSGWVPHFHNKGRKLGVSIIMASHPIPLDWIHFNLHLYRSVPFQFQPSHHHHHSPKILNSNLEYKVHFHMTVAKMDSVLCDIFWSLAISSDKPGTTRFLVEKHKHG